MVREFLRKTAQLLQHLRHAKSFSATRSVTPFRAQPETGQAWNLSYLGLLSASGGLLSLEWAQQQQHHRSIAYAESSEQPSATNTVQVDTASVYRRETKRQGLPKDIILYQYEVCPFCNKVRAFLDYHKVPYRTVEVNPLTKKQLKWSEYKKVPVIMLDEEAINDSSLILSRLAVEFEPEDPQKLHRGWFSKGKVADSAEASASEEEEMEWRQWVDKRFVQVLTVNIYRSLRESWQTFDYITDHGNFNFAERQAARVAGAGLMYGISGKLVRKYGIEGDVREALYAAANSWVDAVGPSRTFFGGSKPNLADISMFGVIRSVTGTDTFMDLMHNTRIGPWYEHMMAAVGNSSQLLNYEG